MRSRARILMPKTGHAQSRDCSRAAVHTCPVRRTLQCCLRGLSIVVSIFDQVSSTPLSVPRQHTCRTHNTHNFFSCESSYVHNCETLECMFDQHRHGSNAACEPPIGRRGKASPGRLQLALAALANRTSPSAYNNMFFRPLDSGVVALVNQARSGMTWHDMYCSLQVADSTRAFRAVSSAQPPPTCLLVYVRN